MSEVSLVGAFERVVDLQRQAVAVEGGDRRLTYAELDERANQLARRLRKLRIGRGDAVGIVAQRTPDTVAAALGVLKAGAAYSPLDPDSPQKRLERHVDDLGSPLVLAPAGLEARVAGRRFQVMPFDPECGAFADESKARLQIAISERDLYAVIFTSGSTGQAKRVALEHRSMLNLIRGTTHLMPQTREGALQVCAPQYDAGAYEIWATLLAGARLVCHPPGRPDPADVMRTIRLHDVAWAGMPTSIFHQLVEHGPEPLAAMRLLSAGGEQLLPRYAKRFRAACPGVRLFNVYGPTEATVFVSAHEVTAADEASERVPVGGPVASARLRIVCPEGVNGKRRRGELHIGGPVLARGYLHQAELTAQRFVTDEAGDRWYRTGDIARWRDDQELEILGRADDQVKLRGYRVEPGEVESHLIVHPDVRRAAVVAREDVPGHPRLIGYVVPAGGSIDPEALRAHLSGRLPEYMVPAAFVQLRRLPESPTGKIDRKALAAASPDATSPNAPTARSDHIGEEQAAASDPLAELIAHLFASVLRLDAVTGTDDFFGLGGDSLLAVQVLTRLRDDHGIELPLQAVFEARTPRALAARAHIQGAAAALRLPKLRAARYAADDVVPATAGQAKALLITELAEESLPYQSQAAHRLLGALDVGALERALSAIVRRHEILRTTFERREGTWIQRVHEPSPIRLAVTDLRSALEPDRALESHLGRAFGRRLDATRLPLAHWSLARIAFDHHVLVSVEHHVVHDGVSTALFLDELSILYAAELAGEDCPLPPPEIQFRDFAQWQAWLIKTPFGRSTLSHWQRRLDGSPATLPLPLDHPRPPRQTYRGQTLRVTVPSGLVQRLEARAYECRATMFIVMLAAYAAVLQRYAGVEDLVIGSGLANRRTLVSEQLLGMVVNTVALRLDLTGVPSVAELIERVRDTVLDAHEHQDVPFERVVEHVAPLRSENAGPLYQALFSFHDAAVRTVELPGGVLIPRDAQSNGAAKADLNVVVIRRRQIPVRGAPHERHTELAEDGVTIVWEYNSDLFARASAERMLRHYMRALERIASADMRSASSTLVSPDAGERASLLSLAGQTAPYEREATVPEVFEARVAERPDAVAVTFERETLTYRQLDRRANRLSRRLRQWGAAPGSKVGVCIERSIDLVVALLAVIKAGAAYLPLDPKDPPARLRHQLEAMAVEVVVAHARHRQALPGSPVRLICLDDELDLAREPDTPPAQHVSALDPVYVMFTSGSTGSPKAVEVPHRAVIRLVRGTNYVRLGPEETVLGLAHPAFDASTFELWGALLNGGRVAMAPPGPLSTAELADLVSHERVTTLWLTAGLFHRVVDDRPELLGNLRQLLAGGDVLSPDHVRRALDALPRDAVLINGYGPTEATTFTCAHRLRPGEKVDVPVPIGRPISNTRVFILDESGRLAPDGAPGELWIGGDGVARGYAGDAELTAQRFRPDPFSPQGARMYRTGDHARWRSDGSIEFLGRTDRQLKIRGFRVEPREVEEALRSHPDIADVYVAPFERGNGLERSLAAYLVTRPGASPPNAELREHAAISLPTHAVPSAWIQIERLPLTASGKVDVRGLPSPTLAMERGVAVLTGAAREPVRRPADALERRLIEIWERELDTEGIAPDDDFFDLGGHSLMAVAVFDAIERTFGRELPLATIFEAPTVRRLAACLRAEGWNHPRRSLVPLTTTGRRPPLFFVTAGDGNAVGFGALARRLGREQPFYGLQQRGIGGGRPLHRTVHGMARHYVGAIRRVSPHGPYFLGGRCLGANVAYEMARQPSRRGEEVA